MACRLHAHLQSLIVKRSMRLRTFWMLDVMDEVVNFNTSCTGKATLTLMTHGSITRTYTHPTFSKNSTLPTPLRLDKLKYKRPSIFPNQPPSFSSICRNNSKDLSAAFISISLQTTCLALLPRFTSPLALSLPSSPTLVQATLHFLPRHQLLLQTTSLSLQ